MLRKLLIIILAIVLHSCVMDYKGLGYSIRNCTNDTLLFNLTASDTLDNGMFWGKSPGDTISLDPEDTIRVSLHGENVILWSQCFALPDSSIFQGSPEMFYHISNTLYIYAVKLQVAEKYSMEEIRAKKLYDRRIVTKKDFHDRVYDYKPEK